VIDSLYGIRSTRASPPGHASKDPERRSVYGSALAQFDELIAAAATAGAASRPLPLFYALSQAGRAIAAAQCDRIWRLRMHGLAAPELAVEPLAINVKRTPSEGKDGSSVDSFAGVADATGSEVFETVATIGALWDSLPELLGLRPELEISNPRPLMLIPDSPGAENVRIQTDPGHVYAKVVGHPGNSDQLLEELAHNYPTTAGGLLCEPQGLRDVTHHTPYGEGYEFKWAAEDSTISGHVSVLDRIAPRTGLEVPPEPVGLMFPAAVHFQARWLRPSVGGAQISSLMSWWTMLFGLSMLARYEPGVWTSALNYDTSQLAAQLSAVLEVGLTRIPDLVLEALTAPSAPISSAAQ
jgi:hypothetical protein